MEHIASNASNHLIQTTYEYNTTVVNSRQNMYPTAYLSNYSSTPSFSTIVEIHMSLSLQVLIHV